MLARLAAPTLAAAPPWPAHAHFDEHQSAVTLAQDQVDLAAARMRAAGDPIIALDQCQPVLLQMRERKGFGGIATDLLVGCRIAAGEHRRHLHR
jgi:hypothetical protein